MPPPSMVWGVPRVPTKPPQVRVPTRGPILRSLKIKGQRVAARPGRLVDDHHFRAIIPAVGEVEVAPSRCAKYPISLRSSSFTM